MCRFVIAKVHIPNTQLHTICKVQGAKVEGRGGGRNPPDFLGGVGEM